MVQPVTFARVDLIFDAFGKCVPEKLIKAVRLSQTRYCGVSAMIARACPIHYVVRLDGKEIARADTNDSILLNES
jgi:putative redox protein